jgi:hypothetical protein
MVLTAAGQTAAARGPAPDPASGPSPEGSAAEAALADYEKLPPAARERWVREKLVRLDRANAVVLAPDEAARQRARTEKLARLMGDGYKPPRSSVENLLRELARRERQAVESLARRYRIQIYRTFRQQEAVFLGRKAAWDRVEAAWRAAGSRLEPRHQLIDWLVVATYRSTPGTIGALPGMPDFRRQIGRPGPSSGDVARIGRPLESRLPWTVLRPELPAARGSAPLPSASPPGVPFPQAGVGRDWLLPAPARPEPLPGDLAATDAARVDARPRLRLLLPGGTVPTIAEDIPHVAAIPAEPPGPPPAASSNDPAGPASQAPGPSAADSRQPRARVNLNELAAGIAGANLALRALEAELDNGRPPTARDLASLVDRLEVLALRHDDLTLFCALITPDERRRVGRLESPRTLVPRLANRVVDLRNRATGEDFTGPEVERRMELNILDELSLQLAELAEKKKD